MDQISDPHRGRTKVEIFTGNEVCHLVLMAYTQGVLIKKANTLAFFLCY